MPRFGGSTDDFVYSPGIDGVVRVRQRSVTFWTAKTGGTQYTDLIYPVGSGTTVSAVPAAASGTVPEFDHADDDVLEMWMDAGGERVKIYALGSIAEQSKAARDVVLTAQPIVEEARDEAVAAAQTATAPTDATMADKINTPGSATALALGADIPKNARKVGVTPSASNIYTSLGLLFADMLANDRAGYIPKGTYTLGTSSPLAYLPGGTRWTLNADPGATIKVADSSVSADYHQALVVIADGTGDVESVDISGLGVDHNRRGQTLPGTPSDWEHSASIRLSGASATSRLLQVRLRDLTFRDPIADCIWSNTYYIDNLLIDGLRVRDRSGVRSDIDLSGYPRNTQINDCIGKRIEAEPIAIPGTVTHDFLVQVSNSKFDLWDLAGRSDAAQRYNWVINNADIGDLSVVYLNDVLVSDSRISFPLNAYNNRELKYTANMVFDNCDFYIYADSSGVIAPMLMLGNTVLQARGRFTNCRFHLVPTSGYAGTFTGYALMFGPQAASNPGEWLVENCWFDARFPYSIYGDRCGTLELKDNDYGGTTSAMLLGQSVTLPTKFFVDGGKWDRVTGSFATMTTAVGGETHIKNVAVTAARSTVTTVPGSTVPLYNSRIVHVTTPLTGAGLRPDQPGLRGDIAKLTNPAVGAPYEWICTTSSSTAGAWEPKPSNDKLLGTTGSINGRATSQVTIYTVPTGKTAVITRATVTAVTATAVTTPTTLGVGIAAGEDDIFPAVSMVGLTTAGKVWDLALAATPASAPAGSVIKSGIDVAATGTSLNIRVDLYGYLI